MTQPDAPVEARPSPRTLIGRAMVNTGWPLDELIAARRPHTSWRLIAFEITTRTGIDISDEAVRLWFG